MPLLLTSLCLDIYRVTPGGEHIWHDQELLNTAFTAINTEGRKQINNNSTGQHFEQATGASCRQLHPPRSPLSRASARGGLRSLSSDSSCGLLSSICWSKAGSSSPGREEPEPEAREADGVDGCGAGGRGAGSWTEGAGCCCCCVGGCGWAAR